MLFSNLGSFTVLEAKHLLEYVLVTVRGVSGTLEGFGTTLHVFFFFHFLLLQVNLLSSIGNSNSNTPIIS